MIDIPYWILVISTSLLVDKMCSKIEKKFSIGLQHPSGSTL